MLNCRLDVEKNCTGQCIPHAGNVHVFFFPNQLFNPNKGPGDSNAIIIIIQSLLSVTVKHCYHFENTIFGYSMETLLANEIQQVLSTSLLLTCHRSAPLFWKSINYEYYIID